MLILVSPIIILFLITPLIQWHRERFHSLKDTIEKSTIPESRKEVSVSVVVPAYNETERLPAMLNEAIAVCRFVRFVISISVSQR